jgi:hypothetical protein
MSCTIKEEHLRRLSKVNSFLFTEGRMIFFGFCGYVPVNDSDHNPRKSQDVALSAVDYMHPRCIICQWVPERAEFALFLASTVQHIRFVNISKEANGKGANQLMTGRYGDYRNGVHKAAYPIAHNAFRQTEGHPIRRTADDFDFDNDDRVEFANAYDNIHAAWSMAINQDSYASAGCQMIVGYPACKKRGTASDTGPWKVFKKNAYSQE